MNHTQGPWRSDGEVIGWLSGEAPAVCVRADNPDGSADPVCMVQPHLSGRYRAAGSRHPIEDARLIAAAPDLLATLKALVSDYEDLLGDGVTDVSQPRRLREALAAIAKAEGQL